jgi:hypothetical protein
MSDDAQVRRALALASRARTPTELLSLVPAEPPARR